MPAELVKTDILVIGAGPAGATTALTLAKLGVSHLVVDAAVFPRDKICGDCLDLNLAAVFVEITNPTPGAGAGRNEAIRGHVHRSPLLLWKLRENPYTHA